MTKHEWQQPNSIMVHAAETQPMYYAYNNAEYVPHHLLISIHFHAIRPFFRKLL